MRLRDYIRQDDFQALELTGTTDGTADTKALFRHGKKAVPFMWIAVEGNVYVPRYGLGPNNVDIRSTAASEKFRILLFF